MSWEYGEAYRRYPSYKGVIRFDNGSIVKCHDIFNGIPDFMKSADVIFTDGPWNKGNIRSFYTKAELVPPREELFSDFKNALFEAIKKIKPRLCYLEIGKEYLAEYIIRMNEMYKYVTFYNSTYYHKKDNLCYIVRGSNKAKKPKLDGMDEEDVIQWICSNDLADGEIIGDLCMGRGLVGKYAAESGKIFVGTELNHKRLSVLLETMADKGFGYEVLNDIHRA